MDSIGVWADLTIQEIGELTKVRLHNTPHTLTRLARTGPNSLLVSLRVVQNMGQDTKAKDPYNGLAEGTRWLRQMFIFF